MCISCFLILFFFFNDTPTTEIYTLSLHDALPISPPARAEGGPPVSGDAAGRMGDTVEAVYRSDSRRVLATLDRKSTRLNSSHANISYAVFCLKKKKKITL